jgi:hypothetical protein
MPLVDPGVLLAAVRDFMSTCLAQQHRQCLLCTTDYDAEQTQLSQRFSTMITRPSMWLQTHQTVHNAACLQDEAQDVNYTDGGPKP